MTETTYGIEKESMSELLHQAHDGRTQLPDFQRGWVWDDERICSLLASISLAYPVGAVMMLESGGDSIQFKKRTLEGAPPPTHSADRLILDGQQRLTSLFQSLLLGKPVATRDQRGKAIKRWYYVDIEMAVDANANREDAIFSIPEDRQIRTFRNDIVRDISTPEHEYRELVFPLAKVFDSKPWRREFSKFWGHDDEKDALWDAFEVEVVERFEKYQLPVIEMSKDTPKEAVCQVFEKVNTGGVTLTVFELLTATFAAENFELRPDWEERFKRLAIQPVLRGVESTDFLQALTLLSTQERRQKALEANPSMERPPAIGCRRADMLQLTLQEYQRWAGPVEQGLQAAARFLHTQHVFDAKFLPYGSQLIPLSAILTVLGKSADSHQARQKLGQWFWCGVFGELYGGTTETRFARDLPDVVEWILGDGPVPRTVAEADFSPDRLLSLRTRNSAAYKGVYTLLLRQGAKDLRTGDESNVHNYFGEAVDIHHIFPQKWCKAIPPGESSPRVDAQRCDSIVNKTPLSATTNRQIGGDAPSTYTSRLEKREGITSGALDGFLQSHFISPEHVRCDDFDSFFEARRAALLGQIEAAMGKAIEADSTEEDSEQKPVDYEVIGEEGLEEVTVDFA